MNSELEKSLEERSKIPIPGGDVPRVRLFAKELALGLHKGLWDDFIAVNPRFGPNDGNLKQFLRNRWQEYDFEQLIDLLVFHDYVNRTDAYRLSGTTVELLEEVETYNVFISYKRSESSAFALLVNARLKEHSLVPFVDMALEAGGNWHADLERQIRDCDYFIILLGKETLSSPMTVKEIQWALAYKKIIIPVWHSGFDLSDKRWADGDENVTDAIQQTNAIIVQDESASGYNSAIVELLNRFGITP